MSEFCKTNPAAVVGSSDNCAQYIDCAREGIILECRYPDLFSSRNQRCMTFTEVDCGETTEPMAPCMIYKNIFISVLFHFVQTNFEIQLNKTTLSNIFSLLAKIVFYEYLIWIH